MKGNENRMTIEQAHGWLENKQTMMTQNRWAFDSIDIEVNGMAILALEKQIPMKPITGHPRDFICGKCHQTVVGSGNYCWFCGQAIDWSKN